MKSSAKGSFKYLFILALDQNIQNVKNLIICCFCYFFELKNLYHWVEWFNAIASGIQQLTLLFHAGWMKLSATDSFKYRTILCFDQNILVNKKLIVCCFYYFFKYKNSYHWVERSTAITAGIQQLVFNNWLQSSLKGIWNQVPTASLIFCLQLLIVRRFGIMEKMIFVTFAIFLNSACYSYHWVEQSTVIAAGIQHLTNDFRVTCRVDEIMHQW
jgi:hypothetical protein